MLKLKLIVSCLHAHKRPEKALHLNLGLTLRLWRSRKWRLGQGCQAPGWVLKACPNTHIKSLCNGSAAAAAAKSLQSCPTLCDPIDGSPPGSPIPGILQARTLEWVAISFSNAWKWKVKGKSLSCVWLLVTPCTAAYQDPPSMGFSRQEYCSGVPLPSSRQLDSHVQKNEDGSLPHTIYKNEVKLNNKI